VARAGGLLAVALLPALSGLSGEDYQSASAFGSGFRSAMLISAGMLIFGGVLSALTISNANRIPGAGVGKAPAQTEQEHCFSCPVEGPRLETVQPARGRT
jgi:hypothetical protein